MAALLADYLFIGPLVQTRLRSQIADLAADGSVRGIETLSQAVDLAITAPTAFVLWEGETFGQSDQARAAGGRSQLVQQQWTVLLAVRNADQYTADGRNQVAGALLAGIHKAIAGWVPEGTVRPFYRTQGRSKPTYPSNGALFPLTFGIQLHL